MTRARTRSLRRSFLAAVAVAVAFAVASGAPSAGAQEDSAKGSLALRADWPVTGGAAPGYVPDRACADCHRDLWESYQHVGMAQSFARMSGERARGDFSGAEFFHERSGNHYANVRRGDLFFQQRWRVDPDGRRYAEHEQRIDWIVGSGAKVQTYLHQTPSGELFQLPVSWYTDPGRWRMSPGYDLSRHRDFGRRIGRQCFACHDAYPDVPAGSDLYGKPFVFPRDLPEGIGCQRCHGPGALHVARALAPDANAERIRAAIVNPARLAPERRDDVCFQCHLQPVSAAASLVGRFGRGAYSFAPGERLEDHRVVFDVLEDEPRSERFEINHHAYRLRQSPCYLASGSELACTTCHDPHVEVAPKDRAAHYRAACLGCHAAADCTLAPAEPDTADPLADADRRAESAQPRPADPHGSGSPAADPGAPARDDCVACHMPQRRTRDVIQVTMTDHRIKRSPAPEEWRAPLPELAGIDVQAVVPYFPERGPADSELELHRLLVELRDADARADERASRAALARALEAAPPAAFEPWLDLGNAHFAAGEIDAGVRAFSEVAGRHPESGERYRALGGALAARGQYAQAVASYERAVAMLGEDPDLLFGLGASLARLGTQDGATAAIEALERVVALRPGDARTRRELGALLLARRGRGDVDRALAHLGGAARSEPQNPEHHRAQGDAYAQEERWEQAVRAWRIAEALVPDDLDLALELAFLFLACPAPELRDPAAGLARAELAVALAPADSDARALLALGRLLRSDWNGALAAAGEAQLQGADPVVCAGLTALAHEALGRRVDADAARALAARTQGSPAGLLRPRVLELLGEPR